MVRHSQFLGGTARSPCAGKGLRMSRGLAGTMKLLFESNFCWMAGSCSEPMCPRAEAGDSYCHQNCIYLRGGGEVSEKLLWQVWGWALPRHQSHSSSHQRHVTALDFLLWLRFWREELLWEGSPLEAIGSPSLLLRAWGPHTELSGGPPSTVCWCKSI